MFDSDSWELIDKIYIKDDTVSDRVTDANQDIPYWGIGADGNGNVHMA